MKTRLYAGSLAILVIGLCSAVLKAAVLFDE